MTARLAGKVAVITGAGSGIGRVAAALFASEGAAVVVADVVAQAARDTVEQIVDAGGRAVAVAADVSDESQVADVVAAATQQLGGLHVLFNNAGIFPGDDGGVLDTPPATWDRVMNVNLKGVWLCCRGAVPAMVDSGGGSIVNVASFVALMGAATAQVAYTASKGGVLAFTRELAVEYARKGIRANALCPGPIETPLLGGAPRRPRAPQPAARAHPHGPPGATRGSGPRRALPGFGRVLVHDRLGARRRRRDHRGLRHPGVGGPDRSASACWTPDRSSVPWCEHAGPQAS